MTGYPLQATDTYLDHLERAIEKLVSGDRVGAEAAIMPLAAELPAKPLNKGISPAVFATVYRRDGFLCRYCGGRVVPLPVLNCASLIWPEVLPTSPGWPVNTTHPIFVARSACLDHKEPRAHGGASDDVRNLVTACYPCNTQKSEFTLERIGWTLREPSQTDWQGPVDMYRAMWEVAVPSATPKEATYHLRWLRAFGV